MTINYRMMKERYQIYRQLVGYLFNDMQLKRNKTSAVLVPIDILMFALHFEYYTF